MPQVGAIVLAAGQSARFGEPKQLVRFRGHTLIDGAIAAAQDANCRPIVVVTGSSAAKITRTLADADIIIQKNPTYRHGIGTSIRAGVERLIDVAPKTEAVVLLVCDQPFVTGDVIRRLIDQHWTSGKPIAASEYSNTCGVPALFDRSCFTELLQLGDRDGAKPIILRSLARVSKVPFPEGEIDIDTPDDYAR